MADETKDDADDILLLLLLLLFNNKEDVEFVFVGVLIIVILLDISSFLFFPSSVNSHILQIYSLSFITSRLLCIYIILFILIC